MRLLIDAIANGGDGIGRSEGKAVFVPGTLDGELVEVDLVEDRGNFARGRLGGVIEPSPERVEPPCPFFARCGGCSWQYAGYEAQLRWKRDVLAGQLRHLGRVDHPPVRDTIAPADPYRYRNRIDLHIADGGPALVERSSHRLVAIDRCLQVIDEVHELMAALGPLPDVDRVTVRCGEATGDRLVVVAGRIPDQAASWGASVAQATRGGVRPVIGEPRFSEGVAGVTFRVGALSFFQANTQGAGVLVNLVDEALQPGAADTMLDGYSGVGLFAATVGRSAGNVICVESAAEAVADARHNVSGQRRLVHGKFAKVVPGLDDPWTIAVVDPPRAGLGRAGVAAVITTEPRAIAYVSCDAASLARDTLLLAEVGYGLEWATPVDMFPQTPHIEAVARFVPA